ncbi:MAG: hypothetical protein J6L72_08710 [Butyricicoccus sp.]|nr:hypothetical protein [Butyricicoccus sp.]
MPDYVKLQYNLWKCSELCPSDPLADPLQAGFIAGFSWAVSLHDAALASAQITDPRLEYVINRLRELRDENSFEAEHTKDNRRLERCAALAEAYGNAYRLLVPMRK